MKQLVEFVPIVLFFLVYQMDGETIELGGFSYQFDGIFSATAVLMLSTLIAVVVLWMMEGKLEKRLLWMLAAVLAFGGLTLLFRNQAFIQWKPTIFNWVLAIIFAGSQWFGDKNLMERTLGTQMELPKFVWNRINWLWIGNFTVVGALNLVVAYNFSESFWVSYKLYSAIGFTLLLSVITVFIIAPYVKEDDAGSENL